MARAPKPRSIHADIREMVGLAKIYAEDGAFHSSARTFRRLADMLEAHANACDEAEREMSK